MTTSTALRHVRPVAAAAVAALALLGTASCSGSDEPDPSTTSTPITTATADTGSSTTAAPDDGTTTSSTTQAKGADDESSSGTEAGKVADWAKPFSTPGTLLTTIEAPSFTVDIYQAGVAKAPEDGNFVDPDTHEPLLAKGDEVVFVNYVFTNTSDAAIPLPYSLVSMEATYADWEWMQGMDGVTDGDLDEQMGIVSTANEPGGEAPFLWEPGTSFAYGENFKHQAGSAITFEARLTPSDDQGDLVHDQKEEASVDTTIQ